MPTDPSDPADRDAPAEPAGPAALANPASTHDARGATPGQPPGAVHFAIDNVDSFRGPTASQAAGLTLGAAKAMMKAAMAEGGAMGVAISVAVVDSGGQLVAFERMDAADLVTITLAQDKAWTAVVNRMPTRDLAPLVQPGAEFYGYESIGRGRTIVFAGGMPLERDGVLVGGVGVSGGNVEEDQRAVDAAVATFG